MRTYDEVSPSRLAEYNAIREQVDQRAEQLAREELGIPPGEELYFGTCHIIWKYKKRILRNEYHMIWRSPQDLCPYCCFD